MLADKIRKILLSCACAVVSWLLLSFLFFPIDIVSAGELYSAENMVNLAELKTVITGIFMLLTIFMYEQKMKKRASKKRGND